MIGPGYPPFGYISAARNVGNIGNRENRNIVFVGFLQQAVECWRKTGIRVGQSFILEFGAQIHDLFEWSNETMQRGNEALKYTDAIDGIEDQLERKITKFILDVSYEMFYGSLEEDIFDHFVHITKSEKTYLSDNSIEQYFAKEPKVKFSV
jgi:hypothetical protein